MGLKMGFVSTLFSRPTNGECLPTSVDACKTTDRSTFVRSFVSSPMGGRKKCNPPRGRRDKLGEKTKPNKNDGSEQCGGGVRS